MMYLLLIYGDEKAHLEYTPEQMKQQYNAYMDYNHMTQERGVYKMGEALHSTDTGKTVRVRDGKMLVTDGPFAETKEQLGGFYLLDCKDLDEAIEMAAKIPDIGSGCIEIRPVVVWN